MRAATTLFESHRRWRRLLRAVHTSGFAADLLDLPVRSTGFADCGSHFTCLNNVRFLCVLKRSRPDRGRARDILLVSTAEHPQRVNHAHVRSSPRPDAPPRRVLTKQDCGV
eukprot:4769258-Pleurochrysis_carterae.AAC.2